MRTRISVAPGIVEHGGHHRLIPHPVLQAVFMWPPCEVPLLTLLPYSPTSPSTSDKPQRTQTQKIYFLLAVTCMHYNTTLWMETAISSGVCNQCTGKHMQSIKSVSFFFFQGCHHMGWPHLHNEGKEHVYLCHRKNILKVIRLKSKWASLKSKHSSIRFCAASQVQKRTSFGLYNG